MKDIGNGRDSDKPENASEAIECAEITDADMEVVSGGGTMTILSNQKSYPGSGGSIDRIRNEL